MIHRLIILGIILVSSFVVQGQTKKYVEAGYISSFYSANPNSNPDLYRYSSISGFTIGAGLNFFTEKKISLNVGIEYALEGSSYHVLLTLGSHINPQTGAYEGLSSTHNIHVIGIPIVADFNINIGEKHAIIIGLGIKPSLIVGGSYSDGIDFEFLVEQYDNSVLVDIPLRIGYRFNDKYELYFHANTPLIAVNTYNKVFNHYSGVSFRYRF